MKVLCECDSFECDACINLPMDEALRAKIRSDTVVIVDGCVRGPEPTDTLLKKCNGYSIYTT